MATIIHLLKKIEEFDTPIFYKLRKDPENTMRVFPKMKSKRHLIATTILPPSENSWSVYKSRIKDAGEKELAEMRSILNKLAKSNLDKLTNSILNREPKMNYEDTKIVAMIFNKIVEDYTNTEVYVAFCKKLYDMDIFSFICLEQFKMNKKQISLCPFIAHLYYNNIICVADIQDYIDLMFEEIQIDPDDDPILYTEGEDDMKDKPILIVATLLKNILDIVALNNPNKEMLISPFSEAIKSLHDTREYRHSMCRCLLMDLYDKYNKIATKKIR